MESEASSTMEKHPNEKKQRRSRPNTRQSNLNRCSYYCDYESTNKVEFEKHEMHHLTPSAFQCHWCSYSINSDRNLSVHLKRDHPKGEPERLPPVGNTSSVSAHQDDDDVLQYSSTSRLSSAPILYSSYKKKEPLEEQEPILNENPRDSRQDPELWTKPPEEQPREVLVPLEEDDVKVETVENFYSPLPGVPVDRQWMLPLLTNATTSTSPASPDDFSGAEDQMPASPEIQQSSVVTSMGPTLSVASLFDIASNITANEPEELASRDTGDPTDGAAMDSISTDVTTPLEIYSMDSSDFRTMKLRVRHKKGQFTIDSLTLASSVKDLLDFISSCLTIPAGSIKILKGFPPVALDMTDISASLSSFGFHERDTVLIDELAENFRQPKFNNLDITGSTVSTDDAVSSINSNGFAKGSASLSSMDISAKDSVSSAKIDRSVIISVSSVRIDVSSSSTSLDENTASSFASLDGNRVRTKDVSRKKLWQCSICLMMFYKHCHMVYHQRIHTGEKPFVCSDCDKSFRMKNSLRAHEELHIDDKEKPFQCGICSKRFSVARFLNAHSNKAHNKERNYSCHLCPQAFQYKCDQRRHTLLCQTKARAGLLEDGMNEDEAHLAVEPPLPLVKVKNATN